MYLQAATGGGINLLDGSQNSMATLAPTSVQLLTGNVARLTVNSSGYVTTPSQVAFVAGLTTGQSLTQGVYQTLVPNFTSRNQGGGYNTSSGVFTAPVAGMYLFTLVTLFYPVASGSNMDTRYLINGSTPTNITSFQGTAPPGQHCNRELSFIVYLSASDTFQLQANSSVTGASFYGTQTAYSGMLIS